MDGTTLILKNDGKNFEKMYYRAVCMGEMHRAERLYAQYVKAPTSHFWRDAFRETGMQDTIFMSAIINLLDIPFGSYVFKRLDDEVIEIAPWLYEDDDGLNEILGALRAKTSDERELQVYARTIRLTADFLAWLHKHDGAQPDVEV